METTQCKVVFEKSTLLSLSVRPATLGAGVYLSGYFVQNAGEDEACVPYVRRRVSS